MILDATGRPLLPSTGLRADVAADVKANMHQYLTDTVHDQLDHAEALAGGEFLFRDVFLKCLGPYFGNHRGQCDHLANVTFDILKRIWRDRYPDISPQRFLDTVHVPAPLSDKEFQEEVDNAWELEIAGSDDAMRRHYDGSARTRKGKDLGGKQVRPGTAE